MDLLATSIAFGVSVIVVVVAVWRETRPRTTLNPPTPPTLPARPFVFAGLLVAVLTGVCLLTFVRGRDLCVIRASWRPAPIPAIDPAGL
jgi:hypothetical protein